MDLEMNEVGTETIKTIKKRRQRKASLSNPTCYKNVGTNTGKKYILLLRKISHLVPNFIINFFKKKGFGPCVLYTANFDQKEHSFV